MRVFFSLLIFSLLFISCKNETKPIRNFTSISEEIIYGDSISIRAIDIVDNELWFSGNNGKYGAIDLNTNKIFNGKIEKDSLSLEFRSIAKTKDATFVLSVANPALLYRISNDKKRVRLVYQEENEKVFYDSMHFLNDSFGIAMGDPVSDCLNIIVTKDGGENWNKIPCENLPKVEEGEAAFAASNTNLILRGNSIFMVSGGKKSRCFVSNDLGKTWEVYSTPIIQGEAMTGIFTADFYDETTGFVAGGNYEKQEDNSKNKAITTNGGKTWKLVGENVGFGYASCVQFVPNSQGKELFSVGGTGVYFSNNFGEKWTKLSVNKNFYTVRFKNDSVAYAAGRNKIVKIILKH